MGRRASHSLARTQVARFDFSSPTDLRDHLQTLANLHQAMRESQCPCAVMLDNKGPEVGIVLEPEDNIHISAGQVLTLTTDKCKASSACIPVRITLSLCGGEKVGLWGRATSRAW